MMSHTQQEPEALFLSVSTNTSQIFKWQDMMLLKGDMEDENVFLVVVLESVGSCKFFLAFSD